MITITDLQTSLLDLLHEIKGSEIKVIIGGGFGIYLKVSHVARGGAAEHFGGNGLSPVPRTILTSFCVLN